MTRQVVRLQTTYDLELKGIIQLSCQLTHPNWNTWKFWKGVRHRSSSSFIGEIRQTDEEFLSSKQHVTSFELRFRISNFHQRQVEFLLEYRSDVLNLRKVNKGQLIIVIYTFM